MGYASTIYIYRIPITLVGEQPGLAVQFTLWATWKEEGGHQSRCVAMMLAFFGSVSLEWNVLSFARQESLSRRADSFSTSVTYPSAQK